MSGIGTTMFIVIFKWRVIISILDSNIKHYYLFRLFETLRRTIYLNIITNRPNKLHTALLFIFIIIFFVNVSYITEKNILVFMPASTSRA